LRFAFKDGAIPAKVALPILPARIKEANDVAGSGIDAREIRALVQIARHTGPRSVFMSVRAVMDLGDNMVELKRQVVVDLRHLAVFATMSRASADQVGGGSVHE
jgi:hypothetical protein